MQIIELTPAEIARVHREHLCRDFPSGEIKPMFVIRSHIRRHFYQCFGLFQSDAGPTDLSGCGARPALKDLLAYAFLYGNQYEGLMLLDYFAVIPEARQKGVGSHFLKLLSQSISQSSGLAAEVESVETAPNDQERLERERRTAFYINCGFRQTAVSGFIFGVDYDIVFQPLTCHWDDQALYRELESLYRKMMPRLLFQQNIKLLLKE